MKICFYRVILIFNKSIYEKLDFKLLKMQLMKLTCLVLFGFNTSCIEI